MIRLKVLQVIKVQKYLFPFRLNLPCRQQWAFIIRLVLHLTISCIDSLAETTEPNEGAVTWSLLPYSGFRILYSSL